MMYSIIYVFIFDHVYYPWPGGLHSAFKRKHR